jgi:hypothetical protein
MRSATEIRAIPVDIGASRRAGSGLRWHVQTRGVDVVAHAGVSDALEFRALGGCFVNHIQPRNCRDMIRLTARARITAGIRDNRYLFSANGV